jgi:hypothetical protein
MRHVCITSTQAYSLLCMLWRPISMSLIMHLNAVIQQAALTWSRSRAPFADYCRGASLSGRLMGQVMEARASATRSRPLATALDVR